MDYVSYKLFLIKHNACSLTARIPAERDEDGAEEGGGGGGAEAGRADHEVAGGEEVGVAGAVVVQQLQDGVVDPGLALREVLLRRAGWERKDNRGGYRVANLVS